MLFGLGVAYYKLGDVYELKSENEAALSYLLQAEEVFQLLYSVTGLSSHQQNYNYMVSRVNTLELQSNDPQIRAIYQLEKTIAGTNALAAKYPWQKELTTLHQEHLAATPNNHRLQLRTAEAYGSLSWYALFAEDFAEAETAARRGLALGGSATEWITTNLATSLLLEGKYDEAVAIYQQYLSLAYNSTRTWREVFTEDLDALEAAGISHKDVARIRALLEDE
jgi:Flp pilus assembly protein TadD